MASQSSQSSRSSVNNEGKPSGKVYTSFLGRRFGPIPGIPVGTSFDNRSDLIHSGVHPTARAGIYGRRSDGVRSVLLNGVYEDEDFGERIVYIGTGGNRRPGQPPQTRDQSMEHPSNAALIRSSCTKEPVRVIRGSHVKSKFRPESGFRYDGLYIVTSCELTETKTGLKICKFGFERVRGQPPLGDNGSVSVTPSPSPAPSNRDSNSDASPAPRSLSPEIPRIFNRFSSPASTARSEASPSPAQSPFVRTSQPYEEPLNMEQSPVSRSNVPISRRPRRAVPTVHITRRRPVRGGLAASQPVTEGESSLVAAMNTAFSAQQGPSQSSQDTHTVQAETDRRTPVPDLSQREGTILPTPQASQPAAGPEPPSGASVAVPPAPDAAEELQAITASLALLHEPWTSEDTAQLVALARRADALLARQPTASEQRSALWAGVGQCMLDGTNSQVMYSALRVSLEEACKQLQNAS